MRIGCGMSGPACAGRGSSRRTAGDLVAIGCRHRAERRDPTSSRAGYSAVRAFNAWRGKSRAVCWRCARSGVRSEQSRGLICCAPFRRHASVQGPGIPTAQRARLFAPFSTIKAHGMGKGLWICRSITESHGGNICCEDGQGGGACFCVWLPACGSTGAEDGDACTPADQGVANGVDNRAIAESAQR